MISETQKEIWTREAAARLCHSEKRKTIDDDIEAITQGVVFLEKNPKARELGYKVADVICEKIGILMANYYESLENLYSQALIKELAEMLHIELPNEKHEPTASPLSPDVCTQRTVAMRRNCYSVLQQTQI